MSFSLKTQRKDTSSQKVLVCGWYGTETAGDKLILLGLMQTIWSHRSDARIYIMSSNPYYTRATMSELAALVRTGVAFADIADAILMRTVIVDESFIFELCSSDLLIFGGGPIMDDPTIRTWLSWIRLARRRNAHTLILGCGLGPLRCAVTQRWAQKILKEADAVVLREKVSDARFAGLGALSSLDPSFLTYPIIKHFRQEAKSGLAVNVRFIPKEYGGNGRQDSFQYAGWLAPKLAWLGECIAENDETVTAFSTHELDRLGDLEIVAQLLSRLAGHKNYELASPSLNETLSVLGGKRKSVAMRYHGAIMSLLMGCELVGIDYNLGGGKLSKLYKDIRTSAELPINIFSSDEKTVTQNAWEMSSKEIEEKVLEAHITYLSVIQKFLI